VPGIAPDDRASFCPVKMRRRIAAPVESARRYGRFALGGKANLGRCLVCDHRTLFVETGPWLANDYLCARCHSIPRWRGILHVLISQFPGWREVEMHECGAGGAATRKLRQESAGYSGSRYLLPEVPRGDVVGNYSCQDIEDLTFADGSFDLLITQDVLEHVLRPDRALAEIARVLRPGGAHIFTVPIYHGRRTLVRAIPSGSGIEHLLPPDYHGGPTNPERSLVIREWGDDFFDYVSAHSGLTTEVVRLYDRSLGLDASPGSPLEVYISRK
jgi:SAM-dependent methyltransferase